MFFRDYPTRKDRRLVYEGRQVRFTANLDEESLAFESELCGSIELPIPQTHHWLSRTPREFRLMQMRGVDGSPAMQAVVYVHRPRRLRWLGKALTSKLGPAVNPLEEAAGIRALKALCTESGDLVTLRLQPVRLAASELDHFEERAQSAGFRKTTAAEVTRTLLFDLRPSMPELLAALTKKTRAKVRHASKNNAELRILTDPKYIPACRNAANASMARTGGDAVQFDYEAAFALAKEHPDRAHIIGLFLKHRPDELLAYVIAFRHGDLAEYSSAGSLFDSELRQLPFNYILVWELVEWAKSQGSSWLDLGGITEGGANDPRAGISDFKRHLSENEVVIGREMVTVLHPFRRGIFETVNGLRALGSALLRKRATIRTGISLLLLVSLFGLFSIPLTWLGNPTSPAWEALAHQTQIPDFAVVGDSRAHVGISPRAMSQSLQERGLPPLTGHNFAVDGTDMLHHFSFITHGLFKTKTPPRVILWTPQPLDFDARRTSNRLEQLVASDLAPLYRAGAPLELLLDVATMSYFPPYRHRPMVARKIFEDFSERAGLKSIPFQQRILGLHYSPEPLSRKYFPLPDGQEPFEILAWPDRFQRGAAAYLKDYQNLKLSQWHLNLARELMKRAQAAGTLLVIVELPVSPYFQSHLALHPKHLLWRERLQEIARQEGAIYWDHSAYLKQLPSLNRDEAFGDPAHMSESTAKIYSEELGKTLAADPRVRSALTEKRGAL